MGGLVLCHIHIHTPHDWSQVCVLLKHDFSPLRASVLRVSVKQLMATNDMMNHLKNCTIQPVRSAQLRDNEVPLPILTSGFPILTSRFPILTSGFPILTSGFPILTSGFPILTSVKNFTS